MKYFFSFIFFTLFLSASVHAVKITNDYEIIYARKIFRSDGPVIFHILIEEKKSNRCGSYIIDEDALYPICSVDFIMKNFRQLPLKNAQDLFNLNESNYGFISH